MSSKLWIISLIILITFAEIPEEDGVWVLNDDNFNEALEKQPDLLVEFYAPWCGHCKKLAPEYSKAAKKLAANIPPIKIAKVDVTTNTVLASKYKIESYPTLKCFTNKIPADYTGGRTEDTIVSYILKRNTPSISYLSSLSSLQNLSSLHKVLVVLFSEKGTPEAVTFEQVAKSIDSVTFALVSGTEAPQSFEVSQPSIIIFKQFDDRRVDYKGRYVLTEISRFVNDNRLPLVIPFGDDAIDLIFQKSSPALFLFANSYSDYQSDMETLSKEYKGILVFSYADLRSNDNNRLAEYLGISSIDQPISIIVDPRGEVKKYKHNGFLTYDGLKSFAHSWSNKKIEAYYKSQEIPQDNYDGSVRVLVGKNFDQVVLDKTKDVLVEFYAPWCGHCKQLAPEYEKLAEDLKKVTSIVVAKMDATANEAKGVGVRGFPTIKFYPANNKSPIEFNGERNYEGLLKFVQDKASVKFDLDKKVDL